MPRRSRRVCFTSTPAYILTGGASCSHIEAGSRRIPVSALPTVARTLSVSLMELFGEEQQGKAARGVSGKRGPMPQWQQHIEAIAKLPRSRQQFVAEMLKNVLGQAAQ